ncbi:hypothetical protein CA236_11295 [Sphingomonas sp. ABOLG]|nr:hypothetical protein CA236_11295 [Sphingomonas sp. ABOLG]
MRSLPRPALTAAEVVAACVASIRDPDLSARLASVAGRLTLAETAYLFRGVGMSLFGIPPSDGVDGRVTAAEMMRVYAGTFVRSARTRAMYDALKAAPVNDVCPLCGQRTVSTLDHYLAQSIHSELVVSPVNLVPACAECNKGKLDHQPAGAADQGFHPYFDDFDDAAWLVAEVVEGFPAAVRFSVAPPPEWPLIQGQRASAHFASLRLGALYASHSGVELANIRYSLERIAASGTPDDVRAWLEDRAESARRAHPNGWQAAMYRALAASGWFYGGGFRA